MTHSSKLHNKKNITNIDERQLFNYKIKCIKDTNYRFISR